MNGSVQPSRASFMATRKRVTLSANHCLQAAVLDQFRKHSVSPLADPACLTPVKSLTGRRECWTTILVLQNASSSSLGKTHEGTLKRRSVREESWTWRMYEAVATSLVQ